jgi:hypothetical protein
MDKIRNFSFKKKNKNSQPYIIVSEFENTTEKDCIKYDKSNQDNYVNLLSKAKQAQYTIRNSGLSMNLEVPLPPRPCNRDRFILWNRRNVSSPVIEQSNAVIFLNDEGYMLNKHYEAYQAIELAKEIRRKTGIQDKSKDTSKDFNEIYTRNDKNIFRRRSMYGVEKCNIINNNNNNNNNNESNCSNNYGFDEVNDLNDVGESVSETMVTSRFKTSPRRSMELKKYSSELDHQASMSPLINNGSMLSLNHRNSNEYYNSSLPLATAPPLIDNDFCEQSVNCTQKYKQNSLYPSL